MKTARTSKASLLVVEPPRTDGPDVDLALAKLDAIGGAVGHEVLTLVHPGTPIPKERQRASRDGHFYTPAHTREAERALTFAFRSVRGRRVRFTDTVAIVAVFFVPTFQRKDADNCLKLVMDAATKAAVWSDDSQVKAQAVFFELDREGKDDERMKLFEVAKVGCFCDAITHSLETRRDTDVKILTLTLRVSPFDAQLANALGDGVRATLFKLNNPEPKPNLRRVDFSALCGDRQILKVFAAPDVTEASIALDQVKITGTHARTHKDRNGYDFVFKASFGPAGSRELEFVQSWLLTQRFVTFDAAEPGMFDDEDDDEMDVTDADEKARRAPMWDEGDERNPSRTAEATKDTEAAKKEPVRRRLHSHAAGKTGTKRPDNARGLRRRRHK